MQSSVRKRITILLLSAILILPFSISIVTARAVVTTAATIENMEYETLQDAVTAVTDGATIGLAEGCAGANHH